MGTLTKEQLHSFNFKSLGKNVHISDKASFHNPANISIGDNTRIDDFCVLSAGEGGISIGSYVHIAVYTSLIGKGKITIENYANLSSKIAVYSSNDDYSGEYMTNPTIPEEFSNVNHGDVYIGKHVIIGSGTIILPGIKIEEGACIGSLSLVKKDCKSFGVYAGSPAVFIKERSKGLLEKEKEFLQYLKKKNKNG